MPTGSKTTTKLTANGSAKGKLVEGKYTEEQLFAAAETTVKKKTKDSKILDVEVEKLIPKFHERGKEGKFSTFLQVYRMAAASLRFFKNLFATQSFVILPRVRTRSCTRARWLLRRERRYKCKINERF